MTTLDMIFARNGMGYAAVWDVGGVEMSVDHLRRRSGEIHGELVVQAASAAVGRGALHRASFNVSSTVARERLAKALADRSRVALPWGDYLEDFCAAILRSEREGAPVVRIGNLPPSVSEGYLFDPVLPEGKTTIIYAPGGTGKSYLAVLCAVCCAADVSPLGWRLTKPGPALYLDWETDQDEVDERVKRVSRGLGIAAPRDVLYRQCAGTLDAIVESVAGTVSNEGVRLVIVDSVAMAAGAGREGSSAEDSAIQLFSAFRYLGTTVLAIDHVTGEDATREGAILKPYGSIYKVNLARSVWELKGTVAAEGEDSHIGLFHRKVNKGSLVAPIGLRVSHGADAVTFDREEINDPSLTKGLSLTSRIVRVLRQGALTGPSLAEELDASEATVRVALNRGRGKLFVRLPDGAWGLLMHEPTS